MRTSLRNRFILHTPRPGTTYTNLQLKNWAWHKKSTQINMEKTMSFSTRPYSSAKAGLISMRESLRNRSIPHTPRPGTTYTNLQLKNWAWHKKSTQINMEKTWNVIFDPDHIAARKQAHSMRESLLNRSIPHTPRPGTTYTNLQLKNWAWHKNQPKSTWKKQCHFRPRPYSSAKVGSLDARKPTESIHTTSL